MRGNSKNSSSISGSPHSAARAATVAARHSGGRPTGMCDSASAVSRPHTATSSHKPVSSDCEYRKLVSTRKKPRKKTTSASRRARSSSVFSAISTTSMVMPASLPSRVLSPHSVRPAASTSTAAISQRPGRAAPTRASRARHNSSATVRLPHHSGKCSRCGVLAHASTPRWKRVSRASRGRCCARSRRARKAFMPTAPAGPARRGGGRRPGRGAAR